MSSTGSHEHRRGHGVSGRDRTMTTAAAEKRAATNSGTEPVREAVPPLKQRIAFVTGGMGGIGTALCRRLAQSAVKAIPGCLPVHQTKAPLAPTTHLHGLPP